MRERERRGTEERLRKRERRETEREREKERETDRQTEKRVGGLRQQLATFTVAA